MPKTIRYIGTQTYWPDYAYTGSAETWMPLEAAEMSDAHAVALLATNLFEEVAASPMRPPSERQIPPSVSAGGGGVPAGLVNWKYSNTRQIAAAFLGAQSGSLRSRMVVGGDSNLAGTGSTGVAGSTVDARRKSVPNQLAAMLMAYGVNAYASWACGSGAIGTDASVLLAYDPRIGFGPGVALNTSFGGLAVASWGLGTAVATGWVTVTPGIEFDTVDTLTGRNDTLGGIIVRDQNDVQIGAIGGQGSASVIHTSIAVPAGTTAIKLQLAAATQARIGGLGFRHSARPGVEIINAAISGAEITSFDLVGANGYMAHRASLPVLFGADTKNIYVANGGANDFAGGQSLATVAARMRSRLTYVKSLANVPDIIVPGYPKSDSPIYPGTTRLDLNNTLRDVALEFDVPFLNVYEMVPSYAEMVSLGLATTDGRHMAAGGQSIPARGLFEGMRYAASLAA